MEAPIAAETEQPLPEGRPGRLNVFALPTRTTILFGLILLAIFLPVVASLLGATPICGPFVVFCMLILPLRDFLRRPDQEISRLKAREELSAEQEALNEQIRRLSAQIGLRRPPRLVLAHHPSAGFRAFGSFTRRYLMIPAARAPAFRAELASADPTVRRRAEAVLLHELSHFVNGDVALSLFAHSLLRVTIAFMAVSLWSSLMMPFLYEMAIRFFDFKALLPPAILSTIQTIDPQVGQFAVDPPHLPPQAWQHYVAFALSSYLPLLVSAAILLVSIWPALLRTRELYADARVVQWQGTRRHLWQALLHENAFSVLQPAPPARRGLRLAQRLFRARQPDLGMRFLPAESEPTLLGWARRFSSLRAAHPRLTTRNACLDHPEQIYGSDRAIAAIAGITVVLLDLALGSLLTSRYLREPNATVPFVIGFTVLSLSLLPSLCAIADPTALYRKVRRQTLIFTAIKLTAQLVTSAFFASALIIAPQTLDQAAYALIGAWGNDLPPLGIPISFVLEVYVVRPLLLFALAMPITVGGLLWLDIRLKRAALTWYGLPLLRDHPIAFFWGLTGWLGLALWWIILPFYNVAAAPTAHNLLDPSVLAPMVATTLISVFVLAFLAAAHRRYAGICPDCRQAVPGPYRLGRRCPHCGKPLHQFLLEQDK
jgi:Zn-dependent protease with chaperone function